MQKYLQSDVLKEIGLYHFDAWAATFGETTESLELTVATDSYRIRTRFSKFVNLPELMVLFKSFTDVQLPSMLNLDVPSLKNNAYTIIENERSDEIRFIMNDFIKRAEKIHNGTVNPSEDNMLKITHDARLISTDIRLFIENGQNHPFSKLNKCIENIFRIYDESSSFKGTQIVFCDIGTPSNSEKFNVYDYIKNELIKKIPEDEISFIHDAKNDKSRDELFRKLRSGEKRIILGSTAKMGTGTNIQTKLIALHEIDVPWRPSDVEQREGRIIRQGNTNKEVEILRYITKGTFDAYNWSIIENKQRFISQIMTTNTIARSCEDIDESVLNFAEMKAIASNNPLIKEKIEIDNEVAKLRVLKSSYLKEHYSLENKIKLLYPSQISLLQKKIQIVSDDILKRNTYFSSHEIENFEIIIDEKIYTSREDAGTKINLLFESITLGEEKEIGTFNNFKLIIKKEINSSESLNKVVLLGTGIYETILSGDPVGNMIKLKNVLFSFEKKRETYTNNLEELNKNIEICKQDFYTPYQYEEKLHNLLIRQKEVDFLLTENVSEPNEIQIKNTMSTKY